MEDPVKFSTFRSVGHAIAAMACVETNGEAGAPVNRPLRQAARIHRFTAAPVSRRRDTVTCAGDDASAAMRRSGAKRPAPATMQSAADEGRSGAHDC